jgi:hypothetical protein
LSLLFFQVLLPAVLIAVVLLILTIKPKIAGPSIPMDMGLYRKYGASQILYSTEAPAADTWKVVQQPLSSDMHVWKYSDAGGSYNMSDFMLATYNDHKRNTRLGAYVFDDRLFYNITVDWPLVEQEREQTVALVLLLAETGMVDGLSSPQKGVVAYNRPITLPFSTNTGVGNQALVAVLAANGTPSVNGLLAAFNLTRESSFLV